MHVQKRIVRRAFIRVRLLLMALLAGWLALAGGWASAPGMAAASTQSAAGIPGSQSAVTLALAALNEVSAWPALAASGACAPGEQELHVAALMRDDPGQQRRALTCHPILEKVAREKAADLAQRKYYSHTNPDGMGPNYLVSQAGYVLPVGYNSAPDGNNIESVAAGHAAAAAVWKAFMESPSHRTHLLGLDATFADQTDYGVGYYYDPQSPYRHYWVIFTARPGP